MKRDGGQLLLIGLLLLVLLVNLGRVFFQVEENTAFSFVQPGSVWVELGEGFPDSSVHQFIDGSTWRDVIILTDVGMAEPLRISGQLDRNVQSGEKVDLVVKSSKIQAVRVSWMTASKRIALGIPLHPDRMSETDWQVLPGIGEKMARKIEDNRQRYGDFVSFQALSRVRGLGKKRLSYWNQYFFAK